MKYISTFFIGLVFIIGISAQANAADIKIVSTSIEGSYSAAMSYNDNYKASDSIDHAENYGFGVEMKMKVTPMVNFTFGFNYTPMRCYELDAETAYRRNSYKVFKGQAFGDPLNRVNNSWTKMSADGERHLFEYTWDYRYYFYYVNVPIGIEITPMKGKGPFQPFFGAAISVCRFTWQAFFTSDLIGKVEDENNVFQQRMQARITIGLDERQRGFIFNGVVTAGFDLMFNENFGFQVKGRYFQTLADNKRNRITGYYNINMGLVFHQ